MFILKCEAEESSNFYYFIFVDEKDNYSELIIDKKTKKYNGHYTEKKITNAGIYEEGKIDEIDFILDSFDENITTNDLIKILKKTKKIKELEEMSFKSIKYLKDLRRQI